MNNNTNETTAPAATDNLIVPAQQSATRSVEQKAITDGAKLRCTGVHRAWQKGNVTGRGYLHTPGGFGRLLAAVVLEGETGGY